MGPRVAIAATASSYKAGELIVLFDSTVSSTIEATLKASRANQTTIGVAEFDSIGIAHQLQVIQASQQADVSEFSRRLFTLVFPDSADIVSIATAYCQLPYVASAEPNFTTQATGGAEANTGAILSGPLAFKPGELIVLLTADSAVAIEAMLQASRASQTTIGIAAFDSIGAAHQLQAITADPQADVDAFSRRLYVLTFPTAADIVAISQAYAALPHVASAEPNYIVHATAVLDETAGAVPQRFALDQNHPNPFNSATTVRFDLSRSGEIELTVHNIAGQKVAILAIGPREAGTHTVRWDGRDDDGRALASGVYVYRLMVGSGASLAKKMLLLR
jgi:hypothetical protein